MIGSTRLSSVCSICAGIAILALLTIVQASGASPDAVPLREVDGGPNYYRQFSNSLPSDPGYFPIGVWFQRVAHQRDIDLDKDAGINLYVVLTTDSNLSLLQRNGMRAILQQSQWRDNRIAASNPAVAGWELFDEVDMEQGPSRGYATLSDILAQLPQDGRMRFNNYGKGVMFWETDAEAARFVNQFQNVVSNDIYWFTDPHYAGSLAILWLDDGQSLTTNQTRRAANYGYTVDRMRALDATDGGRRPIWNVVEVGWPYTKSAALGARAIAPAEVRAAVWHSIIAGARGIIYFNHSFGGPNLSHQALRDPPYAAVRTAVKNTNHLIMKLAPVLNAPFADGFAAADPAVRTMTKFHEGRYFVFAGSKENRPSMPTISLAGFGSGTAIVIGENRTIPISNGRFSDTFEDGNAIHIYRIEDRTVDQRSNESSSDDAQRRN
jgi:hypothetical protein